MTDLRKEFKEKLPYWDGYHFEKSKVSKQVYAYIEWLEERVKNCSIPDVVGRSQQFYCSPYATGDKPNRCRRQCYECKTEPKQ